MSNRDIGELGESTLRQWSAQEGITVNKSEKDKTGWDFILEFPLTHSTLPTGFPLDRAPYPLRCFVQVKSTDKRRGKENIKLDNWVHFVHNPLPTFFLVMEFDGENDCQRAYLVHVGAEYIAQVLKRLRSIPPEDAGKLHKKKMQVTYDDSHLLITLDGKGLSGAIGKHVTESPEDYTARKMALVRSVGYEDGSQVFNFTVRPPPIADIDMQEYFVDFLIGMVPHLDILRGQINDIRFGMTVPNSDGEKLTNGKLQVNVEPVGKGVIRLRTPDYKQEMRIDTDVFAPQGMENLVDTKYIKARFAVPFLNFLYGSVKICVHN